MDRPSGQQTRRRLLDAATGLIAERGWARVTTRSVAERAGLPHGSVSYHFAGKQAMLTQAALDVAERSFPIERLRAATGLDGLLSLMRAWADDPSPAGRLEGVVLMEAMREAGRDPAVRERLAGLLTTYRLLVADLAGADRRRGALPPGVDPAAVATLLAAAGDGLLLHAMLDPAVDPAGAVGALQVLLGRAGGAPPGARAAGRAGGRR